MEMLPIVSLILWSTGLCTLALLGLAVKDVLLERQTEAAQNVVTVTETAPQAPVAQVAARTLVPEPLLKAA